MNAKTNLDSNEYQNGLFAFEEFWKLLIFCLFKLRFIYEISVVLYIVEQFWSK